MIRKLTTFLEVHTHCTITGHLHVTRSSTLKSTNSQMSTQKLREVRTFTNVIHSYGHIHETRFGPYMRVELDLFVEAIYKKRRHWWVMGHLNVKKLSKKYYIIGSLSVVVAQSVERHAYRNVTIVGVVR